MYSSTTLNGSEWPALHLGCFLPRGQNPLYALARRLSGRHSRSGCSGVQTNLSRLWENMLHLCLCNYSDLKNAPMPRNFLKRESVTGGVFSLSLFLTSLLTM